MWRNVWRIYLSYGGLLAPQLASMAENKAYGETQRNINCGYVKAMA